MSGSGCSSWPTAVANDDNKTPEAHLAMKKRMGERDGSNANRTAITSLNVMVQHWPTPQAHDVTARGSGQVPTAKAGNACLATDAQKWSTPRASDAEKGGPNQAFGAGGTPLPAQAAQWPTPAAHEPRLGVQNRSEGSKGSQLSLSTIADRFDCSRPDLPTRKDGPTLSQLRPIWRPLRASLIASHGRATWRRLWKGRNKRRLNPGFVSWLMGWPPGHALCDCSETGFILWQRDMRGALSQMPTASGPWIWKPVSEEPEQAQQMALF
jgi:hypothetical protein